MKEWGPVGRERFAGSQNDRMTHVRSCSLNANHFYLAPIGVGTPVFSHPDTCSFFWTVLFWRVLFGGCYFLLLWACVLTLTGLSGFYWRCGPDGVPQRGGTRVSSDGQIRRDQGAAGQI